MPVLPPTLPAYLPSGEMIGGRRVLVVDERAPDGTALRWAMDALRKLGAREVRSLVLFTSKTGARTDYAGPEVVVITLQPWNRETVTCQGTFVPSGGDLIFPQGRGRTKSGVRPIPPRPKVGSSKGEGASERESRYRQVSADEAAE